MEMMAHIDEENIIDESYDPFFFQEILFQRRYYSYIIESWMVMDNYRAY